MLYQTVTEQDFIRAFDDANRGDNFTPEARRALFEWYEDMAEAMPGGIEFDPIGICCDWSEHTAEEIIREFGYLIDMPDGAGEYSEEFPELVEFLRDNNTLIMVHHIGPDGPFETYLFAE